MGRVRAAYASLLSEINSLMTDMERSSGTFICDLPDVRVIQYAVCAHYMVPVQVMASPIRSDAYCKPRHVAMYLARQLTKHSLMELGRCFARDHGSVIWAIKSIKNQVELKPAFANELAGITASVRAKFSNPARKEIAA